MSDLALHGGDLNISGTGICVSCCHSPIVLCSNTVFAGDVHAVGVQGEDDIGWRKIKRARLFHSVFKTESITYYATSAGIVRRSKGNVFIDAVYTDYDCRDVVVDLSGNMYIAHAQKNSRCLSKVNSSGVFQWAYDFGDITPSFYTASCVALSYDETRVAVGGGGIGPADTFVSLDSDGNFEWDRGFSVTVPTAIDFDAFGNVYVIHQGVTVAKLDTAGVTVWFFGMINSAYSVVTDSVQVYVCRQVGLGIGNMRCVTCADDPASPGVPLEVWTNFAQSNSMCLDADGLLYISNLEGALLNRDITDGTGIWSMTSAEVWGGTGESTTAIHAGAKPVPLPWACGQSYVIGDIRLHNSVVYQSLLVHVSCGPEIWQAKNWTIGDRCYWLNENDDVFILENNNKTGADTDNPDDDADWVEDNDEPGIGNHWTDYWVAA